MSTYKDKYIKYKKKYLKLKYGGSDGKNIDIFKIITDIKNNDFLDWESINDIKNINKSNKDGDTLLTAAASVMGNIALVEIILKKGANIEHRNNKGENALFIAAKLGHNYVVETLLENKIEIDQKTIDIAESNKHWDVVKILKEKLHINNFTTFLNSLKITDDDKRYENKNITPVKNLIKRYKTFSNLINDFKKHQKNDENGFYKFLISINKDIGLLSGHIHRIPHALKNGNYDDTLLDIHNSREDKTFTCKLCYKEYANSENAGGLYEGICIDCTRCEDCGNPMWDHVCKCQL